MKPLMGKKLGSLLGTNVETLGKNIASNLHITSQGPQIIDMKCN